MESESVRKYFNLKRGFTLIELLVVIAIIGILAAVVLANLNTARGKGANAAVKANLKNLMSQAEIYYDSQATNSYAPNGTTVGPAACGAASYTALQNMFGDPKVLAQFQGAVSSAGGTWGSGTSCRWYVTSSAYTVSVTLKTAEGANTIWCVDSNGISKGINNATWAAGACP